MDIMLKIKDEVNLKELEKFGFKFNVDYEDIIAVYDCGDNRTYLGIDSNKIIFLNSGLYGDYPTNFFEKQLVILYDLIKADLVEKVEE